MTQLGERLRPLLDAEQRSPGPTPEAVADCWNRIAADFERGSFPVVDVPPPAKPYGTILWLAVALLGAGLLGGVAYSLRDTSEPVPVSLPFEPPTTVSPPLAARAPEQPRLSTPSPAYDPPPAPPATEPPPIAAKPAAIPKPRAVRPATSTVQVEEDTFAAELRLLAQGQAALSRDDHAEALRIAELYKKTYPKGHFAEDGDALQIVARCSSGATRALEAARRFLRAHPRSIHAARVREVCDLAQEEKP